NVLKYKIALPSPRKKRIALKTWLFGFKPRPGTPERA
ncbi:squalene synthase HpnD, partial [Neisseria gonorrhoeae]